MPIDTLPQPMPKAMRRITSVQRFAIDNGIQPRDSMLREQQRMYHSVVPQLERTTRWTRRTIRAVEQS